MESVTERETLCFRIVERRKPPCKIHCFCSPTTVTSKKIYQKKESTPWFDIQAILESKATLIHSLRGERVFVNGTRL